jgi:glutamyl endopeptidase
MLESNSISLRKYKKWSHLFSVMMGTTIAITVSMGQAAAGPHDPVTSTGQEYFPYSNFPAVAIEPTGGVRGVETLQEGAGTAKRLSDEDLSTMLGLKPMISPVEETDNADLAGDGQESIIGLDTRTRNVTTNYPASAVVLIIFDGGRCSGFMINENTVGTAGHCLHSGNPDGFFDRASFRILPGFDGDTAQFEECGARQLFTVNGWADGGDERYDYGAIKLDCAVGNATGTFGLRIGAGNNEPAIVTGYPGDKPLEQWQASDIVRRAESRQLFYAADTVGGNSGGPVWQGWTSENGVSGPYVIAVHAYGLHGTGAHSDFNHGTRITDDVINNYIAWSDLP